MLFVFICLDGMRSNPLEVEPKGELSQNCVVVDVCQICHLHCKWVVACTHVQALKKVNHTVKALQSGTASKFPRQA